MNSQNEILIELNDVTFSRDNRKILSNISLEVKKNDFIAITGPNGGGKTTLLRIMLKLLKPDMGSVRYSNLLNRESHIGYLPQKNMIDSHFPISVREVIESGLLGIKNLDKTQWRQKVDQTLENVGMEKHASRPIGLLSGGQLQRTLLGRAIISNPKLLILDEPLSYIDKQFEGRFYEIISDLKSTTAIVLVSHEMTHIAEMANRHLIVDHTIHECAAHHHYVKVSCDCPN